MAQLQLIDPAYITPMADGTIKQINPLTGTRVWTVPGRGHRPLNQHKPAARPLDPAQAGRDCAFCQGRYRETPPEKTRLVLADGRWSQLDYVAADQLFDTVAEFRVIPNLFEILSYDYWHANYGFELSPPTAHQRQAYLANPAGRDHVIAVQSTKLRAAGWSEADIANLTEEQIIAQATGFFGGGHDVIVARRHWTDDAVDTTGLASSGSLTAAEHARYIRLTVESMRRLYDNNRYARYVAVFQNWLNQAGASFDHLHKQLVAIDEHGSTLRLSLSRARENPNIFNDAGVNYASWHNLLIAENDGAVAFAGFGHRYPTIEIYSTSATCQPWRQSAAEIDLMSDLIHAIHAASGPHLAVNEEWHHQPIDVDLPMPWQVAIKWRISTVAGFEGGTQLYINTIAPTALRDLVVPRLFELRQAGQIAPIRIATECSGAPNLLRYNPNLAR
ncbi:MAG: DUF4921 family protein [Propionibacteriaceae bacterium]|jgi:galactose-1-phosphate uridylyltransferase|nr:DUF4921 family protein [Propionibacteriaceae bacterium]